MEPLYGYNSRNRRPWACPLMNLHFLLVHWRSTIILIKFLTSWLKHGTIIEQTLQMSDNENE